MPKYFEYYFLSVMLFGRAVSEYCSIGLIDEVRDCPCNLGVNSRLRNPKAFGAELMKKVRRLENVLKQTRIMCLKHGGCSTS